MRNILTCLICSMLAMQALAQQGQLDLVGVHPVFILDHDRISKELELKPVHEKRLKEHHDGLRNESDVIAFLNHLNSTTKK